MIDIRWSFQHAVSSAQAPGTTVADPIERNLKVRCNKLSLGYGKAIVQSKLYVGALLNYGPVKVFTKVGNESDIKKTKYDLVNKNSTLGATVFVAWKVAFRSSGKGPGLVIRPFAELYFWGLDFSPYRTVVNPVQANTFPRVLLGRPTNVGISLQFCGFH